MADLSDDSGNEKNFPISDTADQYNNEVNDNVRHESDENSPEYDSLSKVSQETLFPKRDHLLQWLQVSVSEPESRTITSTVKMQETFTVYLIETRVTETEMPGYRNPPTSTWRRFSEFELLKQYLEIIYPMIVIPPIPEKRTSYAWQKLSTDRFDVSFIERRRIALENFLLRVCSHPVLSHDKIVHSFLKQADGWKESVHNTDYQSKADSKLRSISASYRLRSTDGRFEELKTYSYNLQNHINNILKIRVRLVDRIYGIHKVYANYARVFNEWSGIERDMSGGLQSGSHFIEAYSSSIDSILHQEEKFSDQLKEYYSFGDSLRSICKKQELYQLDCEKAEDGVCYKKSQLQLLVDGKAPGFSLTGMKSKLFGGDTPEQKENKIKMLEEEIANAELDVKVAAQQTKEFIDTALKDIDRFQVQKSKDLQKILIRYAEHQVESCKKSISVWQNAKECFSKM